MSKDLAAKYYQQDKERLQQKASQRDRNVSKEKKMGNMVNNIIKIFQKMKKKLVEYRKNIIE